MPSRNFGDFLLAHWAESVLFFPKVDEPSFPFEGAYHVDVKTFFIVAFPFWVVGVGFSSNFHMPFDGDVSRCSQMVFPAVHLCIEDPIISCDGLEVFLRDPCVRFLWMSSFDPPSYSLIDGVVYGIEDFLTHDVLVILCPSANDWVEEPNEFPSR